MIPYREPGAEQPDILPPCGVCGGTRKERVFRPFTEGSAYGEEVDEACRFCAVGSQWPPVPPYAVPPERDWRLEARRFGSRNPTAAAASVLVGVFAVAVCGALWQLFGFHATDTRFDAVEPLPTVHLSIPDGAHYMQLNDGGAVWR